jgi:hypothetical protein
MRKHLGFALAAAAVALAMIAWDTAGSVTPGEQVLRPKVDMAAPAPDPNLPFQVLRPVY